VKVIRRFVWIVALAVAACSSSGKYTPPAAPVPLAVEQRDRVITYAIDPALDATAFSYECGLTGSASYDFGDALGQRVRDVFAQRYTRAVEVAPELADVVVRLRGVLLRFHGKQEVITYHISYTVHVQLDLVWRDKATQTLSPSGNASDDVFRSFFDVCGNGAEMIGRLTPVLLDNLGKSLVVRLD